MCLAPKLFEDSNVSCNLVVSAQERELLSVRGWVELCFPAREDLLVLAATFGEPCSLRRDGPLIDRLSPTQRQSARPGTMSSYFGIGAFPFHTDGAYLRVPPRFIVLRLAPGSRSQRPTLLFDGASLGTSREEKQALARDVWFVRGGIRNFLSSVVNDTVIPGHIVVRFDRCCMTPATPHSRELARILDIALESNNPVQIDWIEDRALVLDNWRMLHARGNCHTESSETRLLERAAFMNGGA